MPDQQAVIEAARRRLNRAAGLLRETSRELAEAAAGGDDVQSVHRAHDRDSIDAARALIALAVARHGAVDVVVIARPNRRTSTPTTATTAKEN